ncbi:hypothetical protein KEM52_003374 [Ascosphaera acerosa]|nr:hypothetical protein KEM52_003374 [Ascosphaera acerosa]
MCPSVRVAKRELRKRVKQTLQGVSAESLTHQSAVVTERLLALPQYRCARSVAIYLAMPAGEVQTAAIVRDAFARGKRVYVPYIHRLARPAAAAAAAATGGRKSIMEMLALDSVQDYDALQRDGWGIPSISPDSVVVQYHGVLPMV